MVEWIQAQLLKAIQNRAPHVFCTNQAHGLSSLNDFLEGLGGLRCRYNFIRHIRAKVHESIRGIVLSPPQLPPMESTDLKLTPLDAQHEALGAKMVPFAGYRMPVTYAGLTEEHHAVRERYGMFDVSHMGEFMVEGPEALDLIQWISTNDASKLVDGQVQYSCMPNGQGGIVDDLLIYRFHAESFMLVVNASNMDKDWDWIQSQNRFNATLHNRSEQFALIAVQGPQAAAVIRPHFEGNRAPDELKYYTFTEGLFAGVPTILSATGYTGAGGFELYIPTENAPAVWEKLIEMGVPPCGLGARDTLRLEAGFCLYGNDLDDSTSPIAAGLGWITKFTKSFVDRERFEKEKASGSPSVLRGLVMIDRGIPRQGYELVNEEGEVIGKVTSGTMSPTLGQAIGLAYLATEYAQIGSTVHVRIRNKTLAAQVVRPGFLPR